MGKKIGLIISLIITILLFVLLPGLAPMRWIIQMFYLNPIGVTTLLGGIVLFILSFDFGAEELRDGSLLFMSTCLMLFSIFWFIFCHAFMMHALYNDTEYEMVDSPYAVTEFRSAPYAEAKENFNDQNPDARFDFFDLDYVRGKWIADFSPSAGITPLTLHTAGFFEYHPGENDPVVVKRQEMPYAEGGWLWNGAKFFIYNKEPLSTVQEILYIDDPESEGEYMAVTSLIYRKGIFRIPYVGKVMLIHGDGEYELLSPRQAEKDYRLKDVQIMPEWLVEKKAIAYGWKENPFAAVFTKKGRLSVQGSNINRENSAPYHLTTTEGMMWYTPISPFNKESLKGICMEKSGELNGKVFVWMLPGDEAWRGVDALATKIKGEKRSSSINWLRISGDVRSGDTDIIELLPCPREEGGNITLYMCGYVSTDPPKSTRFYTIINAKTQEVLEDTNSINKITQWIKGEIQISPINLQENEIVKEICGNPQELAKEDLVQCIILYAEELENRQ